MSDLARRRRDPPAVLTRALVVGAVTAVPLAAVSLTAESILRALAGGATLGQAWVAAGWTDEDLEMIPGVVISAVLLAGLAAVVAAGVWLLVTRQMAGGEDDESEGRELRRGWVARWAGASAAFAVPMLLLVVPNWPLALAAAFPAGVVALVAEPRVAYEPAREQEAVAA